ncbi:MAG: hypothetical protein IT445_07500 [Phycisphaeraceae bacterium]|nr:hypothetical protein [Phycisphaeraceae bacterium]
MTSHRHSRRSPSACVLAALLFGLVAFNASAFNIVFDYQYDTSNFFSNATARNALEAAAADLSSILDDTFSLIQTPNIYNSQYFDGQVIWNWNSQFFNPAGSGIITRYNDTIAADSYLIFAGAESLSGTTLGQGSVGGWGYSVEPTGYFLSPDEIDEINAITDAFIDAVTTRGEPAGFSSWGGAITFDNDGSTTWSYNHTLPVTPGTSDFYSVALHELAHALGFSSDEWQALVSGPTSPNPLFTGSNAVNVYGNDVPVEPVFHAHWANGTMSTTYVGGTAQEAAMDPSLTQGTRKYFTLLDAAGMVDIGWEIDLNPQTLHPGDANGDGLVNLSDLQILGDNWQSTTADWAQADFTGDSVVNLADLQILGDNWGFGTSSDLSFDEALSNLVVPEPAVLSMLSAASLLALRHRRCV